MSTKIPFLKFLQNLNYSRNGGSSLCRGWRAPICSTRCPWRKCVTLRLIIFNNDIFIILITCNFLNSVLYNWSLGVNHSTIHVQLKLQTDIEHLNDERVVWPLIDCEWYGSLMRSKSRRAIAGWLSRRRLLHRADRPDNSRADAGSASELPIGRPSDATGESDLVCRVPGTKLAVQFARRNRPTCRTRFLRRDAQEHITRGRCFNFQRHAAANANAIFLPYVILALLGPKTIVRPYYICYSFSTIMISTHTTNCMLRSCWISFTKLPLQK